MAKVVFYIGVIVTAISIFSAVIYFLSSDDYESQIIQEMNNQKEIAREKKSSNKIMIYSIIGVFILIVIIGVLIFLLSKYRKNKEVSKHSDLIISAEQAVDNFIKIKDKKLFDPGFCFVAHGYNINFLKKAIIIKEQSGYFFKISTVEEIKLFSYLQEDPKYILLGILEYLIDKKKVKIDFQKHEDLLKLILIIRLGKFGKLEDIEKDRKLLNVKDFNQIKEKAAFLNFDRQEAEENNDKFLNDFREANKKRNKALRKNKKLFQKIDSLIGSQENGYPVDKKSYDYLNKYRFYLPEFSKVLKNGITIYYLLEEIYLILKFKKFDDLIQEKNIFWRVIIKKIIIALNIFLKYLN